MNKNRILVTAAFAIVAVVDGGYLEVARNREDYTAIPPNSEGYRPPVIFYMDNMDNMDSGNQTGELSITSYSYPSEAEVIKLRERGMSEEKIVEFYKAKENSSAISYEEFVAKLKASGETEEEINNRRFPAAFQE